MRIRLERLAIKASYGDRQRAQSETGETPPREEIARMLDVSWFVFPPPSSLPWPSFVHLFASSPLFDSAASPHPGARRRRFLAYSSLLRSFVSYRSRALSS